jgi:hypothetical protein
MKKFLTYTIAFLLPIVILGVTLEVLLRRIPNDYQLKRSYLDHNASKVQTLVLGNSHAFYGINPKYLRTNSFNAANVAQPLYFDYLILKEYKNNWKHLSRIILPVDYFSLFGSIEAAGQGWRVKNYNIYFDMNASKDPSTYTEILSSKFNLNLHRLLSYYVSKQDPITSEKLGWGKAYNTNSNPDLEKSGEVAVSRHTVKEYARLDENIKILQGIIHFAKARNIEVVLITSPAYKSYYSGLDHRQLNITMSVVDQLREKYNLKYVNLLRDQSFQAGDFYDADHLNGKGAKKLSLKLDSLISLQHNQLYARK